MGQPIVHSLTTPELLAELARLLPQVKPELKASLIANDWLSLCCSDGFQWRLDLEDDVYSGSAIVMLLDLLKELGYRPWLAPDAHVVDGMRAEILDTFICYDSGQFSGKHLDSKGKTRGECVARAVVAVLQEREKE